MNNRVLSIDQCKELLALGIDISDASMYYCGGSSDYGKLLPKTSNRKLHPNSIPTYNLQDILEKLPDHLPNKIDAELVVSHTKDNKGYVAYMDYSGDGVYYYHEEIGSNLLEAGFNMLKWLNKGE